MTPLDFLIELNAHLDDVTELAFPGYRMPERAYGGPEGSAGYISPHHVKNHPGTKAAMSESGLDKRPRPSRGGVIVLPTSAMSINRKANAMDKWSAKLAAQPVLARASGYKNNDDMNRALRRHEIVHSIQDSKRGYTGHLRIRDLVKDEIGAYKVMDRRAEGGSKALRRINKVAGVGVSTAHGLVNNPVLRKRAAAYGGAVGTGVLGGALLANHLRKKPRKTKLNAHLDDVTELSRAGLSMATTKRVLGSIRADPKLNWKANLVGGRKIHRKAMNSGYVTPSSLKDTGTRKAVKDYANVSSMSSRRGVTVGKDQAWGGYRLPADQGVGFARRDALAHEAGHAMDPKLDRITSRIQRIAKAHDRGNFSPEKYVLKGKRIQRAQIDSERDANRNAVKLLKRNNASSEEIQGFRSRVRPAFNSYRKQQILAQASVTNPSALKIGVSGPSLPLSATKRILRENPHLRGYGFSARFRPLVEFQR